jgi:hypothetical protein
MAVHVGLKCLKTFLAGKPEGKKETIQKTYA